MKYDVFISYKHTDEQGNPTLDSVLARELCEILENNGYSVFFSSQTLEKIGSSRYKADIDEALDQSRAMIVVFTKAEYARSHWVQYEWDSFYNDYLSGVRKEPNLFTYTKDVPTADMPRTLRNIQNFSYVEGMPHLLESLLNVLKPDELNRQTSSAANPEEDKNFSVVTGKEISYEDIRQAVELDRLVYDELYHIDASVCYDWYNVNPDIYVMAKDNKTGKIIAYVNVSPVTEECYERIRQGDFVDTGITADMLLNYDMPFPYSVYFSSIVIHPDYHNTEVFMKLFNAVIDKFIYLGRHEVYIRRMIADAVTVNGEKFCKMFGMVKLKGSEHNSSLYEVSLIPPKFRVLSKKTKQLFDYYQKKYIETPYLFFND